MWLTARIPVTFVFTGGRPPAPNWEWVEDLLVEANSSLRCTYRPL